MNKKKYVTPEYEILEEDAVELLCGSVSSDNGIGYGGVDTEGAKDPSARDMFNDFDDDFNY